MHYTTFPIMFFELEFLAILKFLVIAQTLQVQAVSVLRQQK